MKKENTIEDTTNIVKKLESLASLKKEISSISPLIDILKSEMKTQKTPHSVYQVMIDCLWGNLEEIQKETIHLKEKLKFETEVYERLKQICLSLTFDEENFHVLEVGSFTNDDDLVKMENSLAMLSGFSKGEYTLKIIKERETENFQIISKFLRRFLIYISKMFTKSESNAELKVHRSFYKQMSKFKFIYQFSKTNREYFGFLCNAYTKKSMDLYNYEFKLHLNRVSELITGAETLVCAIDSIIMTYQSLLECEINFMCVLGIESNPKDIFLTVDTMIVDFIDIFFSKLSYPVMGVMFKYTSKDNKDRLGSLYDSLIEKRMVFEEIFIHQRKNKPMTFEFADLMNSISENESNAGFIDKMTEIVKDNCKNTRMEACSLINTLQILYCINNIANKAELINNLKSILIPKILECAFEDKSDEKNIQKLFKSVDSNRPGYAEITQFINHTIVENAEDENKNELIRNISKYSVK